MKSKKQKLIDICFELVLYARRSKLEEKTMEETVKLVANRLEQCGFLTIPIGSSWGILIDNPEVYKKLKEIA